MLARARIQNGNFEAFKDYEFFFQSFILYTSETYKFIEKEIALEKERYEDYKKEANSRIDWEGEDFMYKLDLKTKEGMADIYFDSLIITLYSFIEKKMLQLCKYYEPNNTFKLSDLKKDGITKYRKYLEKAGNIDFGGISDEWEKLQCFKKLRNNLVHSDGVRIIPMTEKGLINFLREQSGIQLIGEPEGYLYHIKGPQIILEFYRCCKYFVDFLFYEKIPFTSDGDHFGSMTPLEPDSDLM